MLFCVGEKTFLLITEKIRKEKDKKRKEKEHMAFFDEIGKKISHTGQEAVKQTRIMANVAKYKGNISTLESKIQEVFLQIGRQYFRDHESDPDSAYIVKLDEVKRYLQEIEELQCKIQEEKGVAICSNCGAEVGINTVFCSSCGAKVSASFGTEKENLQEKQTAEQKGMESGKICPQCGKQLQEGSVFCENCGYKVNQ